MPIPTPKKDETPEEFMQRCMSDEIMVDEYPDQKQRYGICSMTYDKKILENPMAETFNDYPMAATANAKKALSYRDKTGNPLGCGTAVGWARANQLAKRESISLETVKRMAAFIRHQQYKNVPYEDGCGGLMYDAWGGDEGINWAIRKVDQIEKTA